MKLQLSKKQMNIICGLMIAAAAAAAFIASVGWSPANTPDEMMRYDIGRFIVNNHRLPWGDEPELITVWGFNYSFSPYLPTILGALFSQIAAFFTEDFTIGLIAFRQVSVLSLIGIGAYAVMISRQVFKRQGTQLLFLSFSLFLPQILFLASYFNNDLPSVFLGYGIVYFWISGTKEGWSWKRCIGLAILLGMLTITYFFAYGYILGSVILFLYSDWKQEKDRTVFWKKTGLIVLIAFLIGGWWFIKNAIFLPGDFFGFRATKLYGELYGNWDEISQATFIPAEEGMGVLDMIFKPSPFGSVWWDISLQSYIGLFQTMNILMPFYIYKMYYAALFIPALIGAVLFIISWKKLDGEARLLNLMLWMTLILPVLFSIYNSYTDNYQPQGRYILSNLCPLMLMCTAGYNWIQSQLERLAGWLLKRPKDRPVWLPVCSAAAFCFMIMGIYALYRYNWPTILEQWPFVTGLLGL